MGAPMPICVIFTLFVLFKRYLLYTKRNYIEYIQIILMLLTIMSLITLHLIAFLVFLCLYISFPLTITETPRNLASGFDSPIHKETEEALKPYLKPYTLPFWISGGILQTIIGGAVRFKCPIIEFDRTMVNAPDGGEFAMDWGQNQEQLPEDAPILLIFHGLAGGCREPYIQRNSFYAMKEGYRCCVLTNRGCAGTTLKIPKAYHSCLFDDPMQAINIIHQKYPTAPIDLMGYSLGANTILGLVSRHSKFCKERNIVCCVAISPSPYLISMMLSLCPALDETFSSFELKLVKKNQNAFLEEIKKGKMVGDVPKIYMSKSMKQFDDGFTSKAFNYGCPANYYYDVEQMHHFLPKCYIPCISLNSADDPVAIMTRALFERSRTIASVSPFYTPLATKTGGHLSWTFKEGEKGYYDDLSLGFMKKMNELFKSGKLNEIQQEFLQLNELN
ncbi:hypothetical protein ENUP19_0080G0081 [Entamoeba nuttalli]